MDDSRPADRSDAAFYEQVVRYLDGKITADEWAHMERDLRDSPRRRELFVDICLQAALIAESTHSIEPEAPLPTDSRPVVRSREQGAGSRGQRSEVRGQGGRSGKQPGSRSPVLGFLDRMMHVSGDTPVATAMMWVIMFLCTGMLLTMIIGIIVMVHGVNVHVDAPQVAQQPNLPSPSGRGAGGEGVVKATVARLIHTADCQWAAGADAPAEGDDLVAGRKLALKSGLAEIMFQSGARAVLQGPATLEVASKTSAFLQRGKMTVTCEEPEAHGFEIHTPGMKFTDLGTEFGVLVAKDGMQEVHVFRGRVQAEEARSTELGAGAGAPNPQLPAPAPFCSLLTRPYALSRLASRSSGSRLMRGSSPALCPILIPHSYSPCDPWPTIA